MCDDCFYQSKFDYTKSAMQRSVDYNIDSQIVSTNNRSWYVQ